MSKRTKKTRVAKHGIFSKSMKGSGNSNYARKRAYLDSHGLWGWQVPEPKPWRRKRSSV